MFDYLLESSHRDDSNKWSNIGFGEEIAILEIKICTWVYFSAVLMIRLAIIPVMVKQQKAVAGFSKNSPKLKKLKEAVDDAKSSQDALESKCCHGY